MTLWATSIATADSNARFCACAGSPIARFAGGASTRIATISVPRALSLARSPAAEGDAATDAEGARVTFVEPDAQAAQAIANDRAMAIRGTHPPFTTCQSA